MAATITTPAKRTAMLRGNPGASAALRPALENSLLLPEIPEALTSARGGRRYELLGEIATGGMATVHLARLRRPMGFSRLVAIKHMHPQYAKDPDFAAMFIDEALLTARLRHPNIVPTVDIVAQQGHLLLVMEYVEGASLSTLVRLLSQTAEKKIPVGIACAIIHDVLLGLHAAHEATDDEGAALGIIHRDVSPQNILVGSDGLARLLDFGVAKARSSVHHSIDGEIRGKVPYMAPEQLFGEAIGANVDIWSVGVCLWEMLVGARLFDGSEQALVHRIANERPAPPSARGASSSAALDAVVLRALEQDPARRYQSALEMAEQLADVVRLATRTEVSSWIKRHVAPRPIPREPVRSPESAAIAAILDGSRPGSSPSTRVVAKSDHTPTPSAAMELPVRASRRSGKPAWIAIPVALGLVATAAIAAIASSSSSAAAPWQSKAVAAVSSAEASAAATAAPTTVTAPVVVAPAAAAPVHPAAKTQVRRAPATASAPTTAPSCRLPYTVDADGNRHFRPECL